MSEKISRAQLKLLHALWNLQAVDEDDRPMRLAWASRNCGRTIASFNDLTVAEARNLADALSLGIEKTRAVR